MSPVSRDPEDLARALARCAEIDRKYDALIGPEGRQKMAEIHEQELRFRRQHEYIDRTKPSNRQQQRGTHDEP